MHHRILDTSWTNWIVPNVNLTYIFCDYLYTRKEKLKCYTIKWTGVWIITQWYEWYIHMICAILVNCYFFLSFIEMIFTYSEIRIYKNLHKQNKAATRPRQASRVNSRALDGWAVPVPLLATLMLPLIQTRLNVQQQCTYPNPTDGRTKYK